MKKKITVLLCMLLCLSLAGGFIALGVLGASVADSSIPNYFVDFTSSDVKYDIGITNQLNLRFDDGYTEMTATGADPYIFLPMPTCELLDTRYILIIFRTTSAGGGEIYSQKDDGVPMGQSESTRVSWSSWDATGEWQTKIVDINSMCQSGERFLSFRFDPFWDSSYGAIIDIKCIAGFASESDANEFDLEGYLNYSKTVDDWQQPVYVEKQTTAEDTYKGTLEYKSNSDGTVTISYVYKGEQMTYTVPDDPIYTSGGFAGTDDVGRSLFNSNTVGIYGENGEHYVGLFYFLWMGEHGDPGVYDLTKIQHKYGADALNANYIDPVTQKRIYGSVGQFHWMGEPLYGYYFSSDEWVMRKHVELLTNADVDFLYIDVTNGYTYTENAKKLMGVLHEFNEMGYDAPKIVFYTHSNSAATITQLYRDIYRKNLYSDTWLYVDGKPCIIGNKSEVTNAELKEFFTYKADQWPNDSTYQENAWPWMDFSWPQRVFNDSDGNRSAISVSVAQHCGSVAFSDSAYYFTPLTENNRGRSYRDGQSLWMYRTNYDKDPSITNYGYNFQDQWDYAIQQDVPYVLVTGWNEWIAQRQDGLQHRGDANNVLFIDTASLEFSRDIEMMRGGYFDNYYMQLIYNIQRLKGTAPIIIQDARNPINVTGGFEQWDKVLIEYADPENDMVNRNGRCYGSTYLRDSSGRNDIVASKVTNDTKNAYFYVKTAMDIKKYDGNSSWMQLYVNSDQSVETGWYGYDYIVNYSAAQDLVTSVAKYNGTNGEYSFSKIGNVNYLVSGNEMMIEVPLEMLGITNYNEICLEFKWFDADEGVYVDEMEDFYTYGDAAPLGRLNYVYQNCLAEDVSEPSPNEPNEDQSGENGTQDNGTEDNGTEEPTENIGPVNTDGNADSDERSEESGTDAKDGDNGRSCKGSIGGIAFIIPVIFAGFILDRKRKRK